MKRRKSAIGKKESVRTIGDLLPNLRTWSEYQSGSFSSTIFPQTQQVKAGSVLQHDRWPYGDEGSETERKG